MTLAFTEKPEFILGRAGELLVSNWLQERGWYVIPSYDYSGDERDKAPKLRGIRAAFPVPDLDICQAGDRRWIEVKTKTSARWYGIERRYKHGIEHYADYIRVQEETGNNAYLAILEVADIDDGKELGRAGALLIQSFAKLGQPQVRRNSDGKLLAWFPRDAFHHSYTFTNIHEALAEVQ